MRQIVTQWIRSNITIIFNTSSLVGTTLLSAVLGFVYWWFAARHFPDAEVGLASAAISSMTLLGTLGMLGFGTLMIREIPRRPGEATALIATALLLAGVAGTLFSLLFALLAPYISPELAILSSDGITMMMFIAGTALTAITLVLDQALIGLLRGGVQFWRNTLFGLSKLGALVAVGLWLTDQGGMAIYFTWAFGNFLSVLFVLAVVVRSRAVGALFPLQWRTLYTLAPAAIRHHMLNLAILAPSLVLPVIVTAMLSATANAYFYTAWMMASMVSVGPVSLATMLYATGAKAPHQLAQKARFTLSASFLFAICANIAILIGAGFVLGLFGRTYAEEAREVLIILSIGSFPLIIREHFIAISRVTDRLTNAMVMSVCFSAMRLVGAIVGARFNGLIGLSLGLLLSEMIAALIMMPTVLRTVQIGKLLSELRARFPLVSS